MRAVGSGMKANVAQAYRDLMQYWRPGDSVRLYGFRSAHTARALTRMLVRPGSENLRPYAAEKYVIKPDFKLAVRLFATLPPTVTSGMSRIAVTDHRPDPEGACGLPWSNTVSD
jgi:hypothetical protein